MTRFALPALAVAVVLSACGATLCDRLNTASTTFFGAKTECTYSSGGSTITVTRASSCTDTSACSADDLKTLDTYASCMSSAQTCTTGNEQKATSDLTACAFAAASKLSSACAAAIK